MEVSKPIDFTLVNIRTVQFAAFEDEIPTTDEINISTDIGFRLNEGRRQIMVKYETIFLTMNDKPFIKLEVECVFELYEDSWNNSRLKDGYFFSKGFGRHLAMLTIGTTRGVLHEKTEGTLLNRYILPTINLERIIIDDLYFEQRD